MTSKELKGYLSTRGTTLCLGLNPNVSIPLLLRILGIKENFPLTENKVILLFNNFENTRQYIGYVGGEKWEVVDNAKSDGLRSSVAIMPIENLTSGILKSSSEENSTKFDIEEWNINNVWLFDIFPYQTELGTTALDSIKSWCEKKGYALGVGVVKGYNKYGSTDISSEDDAIDREVKSLRKEGFSTMIIDKTVSLSQAFDIQSLTVDKLSQVLKRFSKDKEITHGSMEYVFLRDMFICGIEDGPSETRWSFEGTLRRVELLFPVVKYLDSTFFQKYEMDITPYFSDKKASNNQEINRKCVDKLFESIINWINRK